MPCTTSSPDDGRRQRHDDVLRDAEQLEAARDAGELGDDVAEVGDDQREHQQERDAEAELLADQIAQPLAGDRAHPRRHLLHDHQRDRDRDHRPQQRVAELRAGQRIGEDAAGVVVDVGGDEARADDGEEQRDARAPALEEASSAAQSLCRSIVITSSAVMMPASRPCSSTTASVIRLYLSKSAATSSCGVSGAQAMYGSLSCDSCAAGDEIGDLDERHGADQLLAGAGQIDRRQRFAAAFELLQRLDRVVDDRGFRRPR